MAEACPISHVIPLRLFQILNSDHWNCNVFGRYRKFAQLNYVRLFGGLGPTALAISHAIPWDVFHGLKSDRWNSADSDVLWGCAVVELHAELREFPFPWSTLWLRGIALLG